MGVRPVGGWVGPREVVTGTTRPPATRSHLPPCRYVFGLRADVPSATLTWDVRLTEAFGVRGYPFGSEEGCLDLECGPRPSAAQQVRGGGRGRGG